MTLAELQALIARVTYRPRWSVEVRRFDNPVVEHDYAIQIHVTTPHLGRFDGKGEPLFAYSRRTFSKQQLADLGATRVVQYVREMICEIETHEMEAWLKLDGKCVVEPHPEMVK